MAIVAHAQHGHTGGRMGQPVRIGCGHAGGQAVVKAGQWLQPRQRLLLQQVLAYQ